jgi:hypothetical protein
VSGSTFAYEPGSGPAPGRIIGGATSRNAVSPTLATTLDCGYTAVRRSHAAAEITTLVPTGHHRTQPRIAELH